MNWPWQGGGPGWFPEQIVVGKRPRPACHPGRRPRSYLWRRDLPIQRGCEEEPCPVPCRLHVSPLKRRVERPPVFKIANCDLKDWPWPASQIAPSRVHRAWRIRVLAALAGLAPQAWQIQKNSTTSTRRSPSSRRLMRLCSRRSFLASCLWVRRAFWRSFTRASRTRSLCTSPVPPQVRCGLDSRPDSGKVVP